MDGTPSGLPDVPIRMLSAGRINRAPDGSPLSVMMGIRGTFPGNFGRLVFTPLASFLSSFLFYYAPTMVEYA